MLRAFRCKKGGLPGTQIPATSLNQPRRAVGLQPNGPYVRSENEPEKTGGNSPVLLPELRRA